MAFVFSSISAESQETLAVHAYRVLVKHCSQCHGKGAAQSDEMLLEHEALLKDGLIRPGSAAKSKLYRVMLKGEMPREKNDNPGFFPRYDLSGPPVPQKEMAIVKRWIETGAPDWGNPKRKIKASPPESYWQPDTIGFAELFAYKDVYKSYLIRDWDVSLVIDFYDGGALGRLDKIGVKPEELASTRHHREQCQSAWKLDCEVTKVATPEGSVSSSRTRPSLTSVSRSWATSFLQIVHFDVTLDGELFDFLIRTSE